MKIEYIPCDMKCEKVVSHNKCFLQLENDHATYRLDYVARYFKDCEDPMLGSKEEPCFFEIKALRSRISAVELDLTRDQNWCVTMYVLGSSRDISIYFTNKDRVNAEKMHKAILEWWNQ